MSFFKKIFTSSNPQEELSHKDDKIKKFGRYTEVNKTSSQLFYWDKALKEFSQKNYIESFSNLLNYMLDPAINNVTIIKDINQISFEIIQGSKIIRGKGNNNLISAEVKIAKFDSLSVAFLRKLMNMNFVHQYTRFALKDDIIYLKFDSKAIDASPNKVYFSLKELALKADKIDDILIGEFDNLHPIDVGHITPIADNIKEVKYNYFNKWINDSLNKIANLNDDKMSGGISFIILSLLFRIDYLLQPQGELFNDIDRINEIYNAKNNMTTYERNRLMIEELTALVRKDKEIIKESFYEVKCTFGYVPVTSHKQFYEFIVENFKNTTWYYENRYDDIVTNIYEWIIGYSIFYFGLYPATYDLLQIAYAVMQPDFMNEMENYQNFASSQTKQINKVNVEKEIQKVIKKYSKEYPKLSIMYQNISYRSMNEFLYSFLNELTYLNFQK